MPEYPPLAAFAFNRVCNCRGISRDNIVQALDGNSPMSNGEDLYNAALEHRLADIIDGRGGLMTGKEASGTGYNCGTCEFLFDEVVAYIAQTRPYRIIPIAPAPPAAR